MSQWSAVDPSNTRAYFENVRNLGGQINWLVVISGFVLLLLFSILAGAFEHQKGDDECCKKETSEAGDISYDCDGCLSKTNRGWRAFSAVWFVFSIIYIIIILMFGRRV